MEKEVMEGFVYIFLLLGLVIETMEDIREKQIWIPIVIFELPVLLGFNYGLGKGGVMLWAASLGIGAVFYLVSVVTAGQIGKGDAFIFGMTGAGIGLSDNLILIYLTFLFAFLAAAFLWLVKKVDKKYCIPLTPFILLSYILLTGSRFYHILR